MGRHHLLAISLRRACSNARLEPDQPGAEPTWLPTLGRRRAHRRSVSTGSSGDGVVAPRASVETGAAAARHGVCSGYPGRRARAPAARGRRALRAWPAWDGLEIRVAGGNRAVGPLTAGPSPDYACGSVQALEGRMR